MKKSASVLWIISSILLVIFGVFFIFNPELAVSTLVFWIGLSIIFSGVMSIKEYQYIKFKWMLFDGIISILFGVLLLFLHIFTPLTSIIAIIFGIWVICKGLNKIVQSIKIKKYGINKWYKILLIGILEVVFVLIAFIKPIIAMFTVALSIGMHLIVSGASSIVTWNIIRKIKSNSTKEC